MIFSAIAGWFVKRFWPTGLIIVIFITIANAVIQFFRYQSINSNRELLGEGTYPNNATIVFGGAAIELVINLVVFLVVWMLRRKFKPHSGAGSPPEL